MRLPGAWALLLARNWSVEVASYTGSDYGWERLFNGATCRDSFVGAGSSEDEDKARRWWWDCDWLVDLGSDNSSIDNVATCEPCVLHINIAQWLGRAGLLEVAGSNGPLMGGQSSDGLEHHLDSWVMARGVENLKWNVCVPKACLHSGRGAALWSSLRLAAFAGTLGSLGGALEGIYPGVLSDLSRLPAWRRNEAELFLKGGASVFGAAPVHSVAGGDCSERVHRVEVGRPLPPICVGHECVPVVPELNRCGPQWDHIEVPEAHRLAQCLRALEKVPAEFYRHLGTQTRWDDPMRNHMVDCQQRAMRVYWVMELDGMPSDSGTVLLKQVVSAFLVCVPSACDAYSVGVYFTRSVVFGVRQVSNGFFRDARIKRISSVCFPGYVRLPPRSAFPVADDINIRSMLGDLSEHVFRLAQIDDGNPNVNAVVVAEQRFPRPPSAPGPLSQSPDGVALLFGGSWRFSQSLVRAIRRHVIEPLGATVFAVMSLGSSDESGAQTSGDETATEFASIVGDALAGFAWVEDLAQEDLIRDLSASGVLNVHLLMRGWDITPLGSKVGTSLHAYRKIEAVLDLTQQHEDKQGRRFKWLIFSRTDLIWVADHPPLALLDPNVIWSMGGQDWHVAVPRDLADAFFRRWTALREGVAPMMPRQNPGLLLMNMIAFSGVKVASFPSIGSLASCTNWSCYASTGGSSEWRWPATHKRKVMRIARGLRSGSLGWAQGSDGLPVVRFNGTAGGAARRVVASSMMDWSLV